LRSNLAKYKPASPTAGLKVKVLVMLSNEAKGGIKILEIVQRSFSGSEIAGSLY
jgi:hypothetical protein